MRREEKRREDPTMNNEYRYEGWGWRNFWVVEYWSGCDCTGTSDLTCQSDTGSLLQKSISSVHVHTNYKRGSNILVEIWIMKNYSIFIL